MKLIRNLSLAAIALFSLVNLTACNTVEGAGKDIKAGGEAIEREADKANK
ncbi:MAG: entericidin A/B family lipoprotein [Pseudomonadota bacterium]